MRAVFFGFWLRFGSVTGLQGTCSFAKASPKPKNPRSERLHCFLKRSKADEVLKRAKKVGDLIAPVLELKQRLPVLRS